MTEVKTDGIYSFTLPAVMSFPTLFEAKAFKRNGKETGEPKFSASFNFDPASPDLDAMKKLCAKLARAKWPGLETLKGIKFPFSNGDALCAERVRKLVAAGKSDDGKGDFQKGKVVLKTASKYAPRLSIIHNGKVTDLEVGTPLWTSSKGLFFFGAEVLAQVNFVPYDRIKPQDPDGITAYLNMVFATGKGTKLSSGGAPASEVFKGYVGTSTTENPLAAGIDDEIPF